jgi:transposase
MRWIGLDVGRDFAHAAIVEGTGTARKLGRFRMGEEFGAFAATLRSDDVVALEASTNTWALAELLGRYAGRVVVSNPLRTRAIAAAKHKTDDIDAATLAELLAADYLPEVWQPDEATRRLRRLVAHRASLVRDRTATRNRVSAILARRLVRAPVSDLFGVRGRAWLAGLALPAEERLAMDAALRLEALLRTEVEAAERAIAELAIDDPRFGHLLTIPGIGLATAAGLLATIGDIGRFNRPAKLVSYLGLDPRVRQSGDRPPLRGHISRAGQAHARGLLTEAAHAAVKAPGPLATFHARLRHRRGAGIAIIATARKLAVLVWHLLTKDEDCRFAPPARTALKRHALERLAGRPTEGTRSSQRGATGSSHDQGRARLRGGIDPHEPALRQAIDRVRLDDTSVVTA